MGKIKRIKELKPRITEVREISESKEELEKGESLEREREPFADNFENIAVTTTTESPQSSVGSERVISPRETEQRENIEIARRPQTAISRPAENDNAGWRSFYEARGAERTSEEEIKDIYKMPEQTASATLKPIGASRSLVDVQPKSLTQESQRAQNLTRTDEDERERRYAEPGRGTGEGRARRRYPWEVR